MMAEIEPKSMTQIDGVKMMIVFRGYEANFDHIVSNYFVQI